MKKNQKRLMYLSGVLVGLGALKIYLNKKNKEKCELNVDDLIDNYNENHLKEEKYTSAEEPVKGFEKRNYITIPRKKNPSK